MPGTAGPQNPAASAVDAPSRAAPPARTAAGIGRRAWEQFADNPLQALLGTAIVALLIFNFTTLNARIDDTNARIDRLEERMDARFAALEEDVAGIDLKMTALIAALEEDAAELNLKMTALIAALNRADEVDAALKGRLIDRTPIPDPSNVPAG